MVADVGRGREKKAWMWWAGPGLRLGRRSVPTVGAGSARRAGAGCQLIALPPAAPATAAGPATPFGSVLRRPYPKTRGVVQSNGPWSVRVGVQGAC